MSDERSTCASGLRLCCTTVSTSEASKVCVAATRTCRLASCTTSAPERVSASSSSNARCLSCRSCSAPSSRVCGADASSEGSDCLVHVSPALMMVGRTAFAPSSCSSLRSSSAGICKHAHPTARHAAVLLALLWPRQGPCRSTATIAEACEGDSAKSKTKKHIPGCRGEDLGVVDAIHLRGPPAPCTTLRSLALILLSPGARTLLLRLTLSLRIPSVLHPRVSLRCVAPFRLRENRHAPHDPRRLLHHQLCKRTIRHAHRRRQPDLRLTSSHPLLAAARAACHALAAFLSCLHVASLLCSLYQCWRAPARRPARRHLGAAASFPRPIHPRPVHLRLNRRKPVHAGVRRAWGVARGRGRVAWADGSVDCRLRGLG
eukprot:313412-Rhodomonas_salina.1